MRSLFMSADAKTIFHATIKYAKDPYDCVKGADAVIILYTQYSL